MALWTPQDIATDLWLDASDTSTITIDTGVSNWADKSGNGLDMVQTTGTKQPTVISAGQNGLNYLQFDGTDDYLSHSGFFPNIYTTFAVVKNRNLLSTTIGIASQNSNSLDAGRLIFFTERDSGTVQIAQQVGSFVSKTGVRTGGFNVLGFSREGTVSNLYYNGDAATTGTVNSNTIEDALFYIGQDGSGGHPELDFCEFIVFSSVLSDEERQKIEGYLAWKWGLEYNLPVDHPYKDVAPIVSPLWTPQKIDTDLWLDASDSSTITIDTGVSEWGDKSGNDRHFLQPTPAKQPSYSNNSLTTDGSSQYLTLMEDNFLNGLGMSSEGVSIFIVGSSAVSSADFLYPSNPLNLESIYAINGGQYMIRTDTGSYGISSTSPSGMVVNTTPNLFSSTDKAGVINAYKDGVNEYTQAYTISNSLTTTMVSIGALVRNTTVYIGVEVREILVVSGVDDRQKIEGYLAWKWGLEANLSADHPYKNAAPVLPYNPDLAPTENKLRLTLDSSQITTSLTDFPIVVKLDSTNPLHTPIFDDLGVNSKKLSIEADGTQCPIEIESWGTVLSQFIYADTEPIAHWTMDNISGTTLVDEMGTYDGTINGRVGTTEGKFDNYLEGGDITNVVRNVDFGEIGVPFKTISLWTRSISVTAVQYIIRNEGSSSVLAIRAGDEGNYLALYDGTTQRLTDLAITENVLWHNVVLVEGSDNNTHWVWLDGVKASSELATNMLGRLRYLGRDSTSTEQYVCPVDNVQVYDYILTDEEIATLYASQVSVATLHTKVPTYSASTDAELILSWDSKQVDNVNVGVAGEALATIADDFTGVDGDEPDSFLWDINKNAQLYPAASLGEYFQIKDNSLSMYSANYPTTTEYIDGICLSVFSLNGDFNFSVDFGVFYGDYQGVNLYKDGAVNVDNRAYAYNNRINGTKLITDKNNGAGTSYFDEIGTFSGSTVRFKRTGATLEVFEGELLLSTINFGTTDVIIGFFAGLQAGYSSFNVSYDNFIINSGTIFGISPATKVWDSSFVFVSHQAQDPSGTAPQILDSTSNANHGTSYGSMTSGDLIDGATGKMIEYDGVDDTIGIGNPANFAMSKFTVEAYVDANTSSTDVGIISNYGGSGTEQHWGLRKGSTDLASLFYDDGTAWAFMNSTETIVSGTVYIAGILDGGNEARIYLDGALNNTDVTVPISITPTGSTFIGKDGINTDYISGAIGEVRVSNIVRSDDWIKATNLSLTGQLIAFSTPIVASPYKFTGYVQVEGIPAVRPVLMFDRNTYALETWTTSASGTGYFELAATNSGIYFINILPELDDTYNILAYDKIILEN